MNSIGFDIKRINEIKEALKDTDITFDEYCRYKEITLLEEIKDMIPYVGTE